MADPHVITALNAKYARLTGELQKLNRQADKVRADLAHIEATIRLFRADWVGEAVKAIGPIKPSRWKRRSQGLVAALNIMREAGGPMTAREIAARALSAQGIELPDGRTLSAVAGSLTKSMERRIGNGVTMIEGRPRRWQLTGKAGDPAGGWRNGATSLLLGS